MTTHLNVSDIANSAVDDLQVSCEYLRWMAALGVAIRTDLTTGRGLVAKDLASLVQFLSQDQGNALDDQIQGYEAGLRAHDLRA